MSSLGKKAKSAVVWNTAFNLFRDFQQFVVMLVLVRLLKPEAYGQFALVNTTIGFITIFSFNNFIAYTLQVRDDDDVHYQTHFTASGMIAVAAFLVANLVAVAVRGSPTYAPVSPLVHVMSLTFLLEWPCEFRRKMLERNFDWKRLRLLHASGLAVSAILAVVMGALGAGVYALLVPGLLVTLPFTLDLFFWTRWKPTWSWSWAQYRDAWHFGVTRIGSGMATSGRRLLESATLAKVLGFTELGFFNRALGLSQMFCQKFAVQLMYAIYPVLTRLNPEPENVARVNGLVLRLVAWAAIPTAVIFGVLALPVIQTVYGPKWLDVVPLLSWAMARAAMGALCQVTNQLLLSRQRQRLCLVVDVLTLGGTGLMLVFALPRGAQMYLAGVALVQLVNFTLMCNWLCRMGALRMRGILHAFVPVGVAVGGALGICELVRRGAALQHFSFGSALAYGVVYAAVFCGILRMLFAQQLGGLIRFFPARKFFARLFVLQDAALAPGK